MVDCVILNAPKTAHSAGPPRAAKGAAHAACSHDVKLSRGNTGSVSRSGSPMSGQSKGA